MEPMETTRVSYKQVADCGVNTEVKRADLFRSYILKKRPRTTFLENPPRKCPDAGPIAGDVDPKLGVIFSEIGLRRRSLQRRQGRKLLRELLKG